MGSARRAFGGTNVVVACQIASEFHSDSIQIPFIALPQALRASKRKEGEEREERARQRDREREKREIIHRRKRERNKREREITKVTHKWPTLE